MLNGGWRSHRQQWNAAVQGESPSLRSGAMARGTGTSRRRLATTRCGKFKLTWHIAALSPLVDLMLNVLNLLACASLCPGIPLCLQQPAFVCSAPGCQDPAIVKVHSGLCFPRLFLHPGIKAAAAARCSGITDEGLNKLIGLAFSSSTLKRRSARTGGTRLHGLSARPSCEARAPL